MVVQESFEPRHVDPVFTDSPGAAKLDMGQYLAVTVQGLKLEPLADAAKADLGGIESCR